MKILFIALLALPVFADETLPVEDGAPVLQADTSGDEPKFNPRAAHWIGQFNFEQANLEFPFTFAGATKNYNDRRLSLYGMRAGFGRELYIPGGFLLGGRLDAYYLGTLFTSEKTVSGADNIVVRAEKTVGQMYGGEAVAHLGWMFDYLTENPLGEMGYFSLEIFGEAGLGVGRSYARTQYESKISPVEYYRAMIEDEFTSQTVSAGFNILSNTTGFFMTLKGSRLDRDVTKRKYRKLGDPDTTVEDPAVDPVYVFTLGGGYKF